MKISTEKKGIILLSGGLDSVVSLAVLKEKISFETALTFNYGQKSFEKEYIASKKIAGFYNINHKSIELSWLKEITNSSLVSGNVVPDIAIDKLNDSKITKESMKSVWVPNRNALFINIAAAFADSYKYDFIVIGANKEEAATFSDNSKEFINDINKSLKTSTNHDIEVLAPLIDFEKREIIQKALEHKVPLQFINSCYNSTKKHCGRCESCNRLKRALKSLNQNEIIDELFEGEK